MNDKNKIDFKIFEQTNYKIDFKIFDLSSQNKLDLKPSDCHSMIILNQIHSNIIVSTPNIEFDGDASITENPITACCVLTADCLPILAIDEKNHKIASIHAGWRGLASGIVEKVLANFSVESKVILAPSISGAVYEVGSDVIANFTKFKNCYTEKSKENNGKFLLDIRKVAKSIIASFGITSTIDLDICTFSSNLPSYRRDKTKLRLASMVWLAD